MFNKLHSSVKIPNWILAVVALLIITTYLAPRAEEVDIKPIEDEIYHVTDGVAEGSLSKINPFDSNYRFLGHTPGYRISLFLWFKVFPKDYVSAKYHGLTFSYLTLILFFLLCWQHMYWLSAIVCTLLFGNSASFFSHTVHNLADIPSLLFLFSSLYFTSKGRWKTAGLACFLYVLFRESGIALLFSYIVIAYGVSLVKKRPSFTSKLPVLVLPALVAIGTFFIGCRIYRGSLLMHPYAHGLLGHTKVTFFSWNAKKIETLDNLTNILLKNLPISMLIASAIAICVILLRRRIQLNSLSFFSSSTFGLTGLFFFAFFTLYGDSLPRDIIPTIASVYFLSFALIHKAFRKWSFIPIGIIVFTIQVTKTDPDRMATSQLLTNVGQYIEANHFGSKICLGWPYSWKINIIHGYFSQKKAYIQDCKKPDVMIISSFQREAAKEKRMDVVKEQKMKQLRTFTLEGSKHNFAVYAKGRSNEKTVHTR